MSDYPSEEIPSTTGGGRLGRIVDHGPHFQSRTVSASQVPAAPTQPVFWTRHCPPYDQGNLGSCTGNATAGALMTEPLYQPSWNLTEDDAVKIYSQASKFNPDGQSYPPTDAGSSGSCVVQALEQDGLVVSSVHATDLDTALGLLSVGPVIFGIPWMSSFDTPLPTGECALTPDAIVRGGHEIQAYGVDPVKQQVWFYQSWGPTWGGLGNGTFWLSFDTLRQLFTQQTDATSFTLANPIPALDF